MNTTWGFLKTVLIYNPDTGNVYWKARTAETVPDVRVRKSWNTRYAGKQIGVCDKDGYRRTCLFGKNYLVHRLVWMYVYGVWPKLEIRHINRDNDDNRVSNLRLISLHDKCRDRKARCDSSTDIVGVCFNEDAQRYQARIYVDKKTKHLGYFSTIEGAAEARKRAEAMYWNSRK